MKRHVPAVLRGRRLGAMSVAMLVVATLAFWAIAATRSSSDSATPATITSTTQAPGAAGMIAALDPVTGTLVEPSLQQILELDAQMKASLSQSDQGLEMIVHPDGHASVDLQGRYQSATIAHIGADGKVHTSCVSSHDAACQALATPPAGPEVK
jgi:hypothetical protein